MSNGKVREVGDVVGLMDRIGVDAKSASAELATASTAAKKPCSAFGGDGYSC